MKKTTLGLLAIACVGATAFGIVGLNNGVSANAETASAFSTFAMTDGAQIMVGNTEAASAKRNGMRWQITMDKTAYNALSTSGYTDIQFGVLIAPAEGYTLTEETVFGANAIYDWAIKQDNGSYVYSGTKTRIMNLYTDALNTPEDESKSYVEFYGGIMNLKDDVLEDGANNLARDFQAIGYVQYTDGETVKYVMVGDEDNVRSMAYVAQLAIADESDKKPADEVKTWLADYYIAKAPSVKWYVEHYKQLSDGTYSTTPDEVGEYTGPVSAIANAKGSAKNYEGYTLNDVRSENYTGFVWANGSTSLKLFYEKNDLAVKYGDYNVSFVQKNFTVDAMENTIVGGKLVTIVGDSYNEEHKGVGNAGWGNRPELVISGLKAGKPYTVTVSAMVNLVNGGVLAPYYTSDGKFYKTTAGGAGAEGENTWTVSNLVADENGQIVFGSWYSAMATITWTEITAVCEVPTYGDISLSAKQAVTGDNAQISVNAQSQLVITTIGTFGGNSVDDTAARLTVSGLTAGQSYNFDMTIDFAFRTSDTVKGIIEFRKLRSNSSKGRYSFVEGTTGTDTNGNSVVGKVVNNYYLAGKYVIRLNGTADANGEISFNGLYISKNCIFTVTNFVVV